VDVDLWGYRIVVVLLLLHSSEKLSGLCVLAVPVESVSRSGFQGADAVVIKQGGLLLGPLRQNRKSITHGIVLSAYASFCGGLKMSSTIVG
jgi:hypothetical protein